MITLQFLLAFELFFLLFLAMLIHDRFENNLTVFLFPESLELFDHFELLEFLHHPELGHFLEVVEVLETNLIDLVQEVVD